MQGEKRRGDDAMEGDGTFAHLEHEWHEPIATTLAVDLNEGDMMRWSITRGEISEVRRG